MRKQRRHSRGKPSSEYVFGVYRLVIAAVSSTPGLRLPSTSPHSHDFADQSRQRSTFDHNICRSVFVGRT